MLRWYSEVIRLFNWLLGYPDGDAEIYIVWIVSVLTLLITMRCACAIYGILNMSWIRITLVLVIGVLSLIGVAAITSLHLLRFFNDPTTKRIVMFVTPILMFVVFVIPAQCEILKSSFLKMFLAFTSSALVAILAINVTHACYKSFDLGQNKLENIRSRSTNFESFVGE
jgi:hypothetical protein